MDATQLKTFGLMLDQLAAVFNVRLDLPKKHAYWVALEDQKLEAVQHACAEVLKTEGFFPVPAILRTHAREWQKVQAQRAMMPPSEREVLALREATMPLEEVRALIAEVWPEDKLKDPIPPYEEAP